MGNSSQDVNRVITGRSYIKVDEINYKEITERLVKLERTLTGYADSYNIPSLPPLKSVIGWHKDLGDTVDLPGSWVECNGQTIDDPGSPLNGQVIPDLNGEARFLRGSSTAGTEEADAFQGHHHTMGGFNPYTNGGATFAFYCAPDSVGNIPLTVDAPESDGVNGTPRTASETRPINMSVVWIMRIR